MVNVQGDTGSADRVTSDGFEPPWPKPRPGMTPRPFDMLRERERAALDQALETWRRRMLRKGWIDSIHHGRAAANHAWVVATYRLQVPEEHLS